MEKPFNDKVVEENEIEIKPIRKGDRLLRSEAARSRRRKIKQVKEKLLMNEWAKQRRERKKSK